jgi:hypothetical protein
MHLLAALRYQDRPVRCGAGAGGSEAGTLGQVLEGEVKQWEEQCAEEL